MRRIVRWSIVIAFSPAALFIILIMSSILFLFALWAGLASYARLTVPAPSSDASTRS